MLYPKPFIVGNLVGNMKFKWYALKLSLFCILIFMLQLVIPGFTELFVLNDLAWSEGWRFVTAVFLHGGLGHLLYNLFALALFGSFLEKFIGGTRFLLIFFVTGIGANLVSVNFYNSSLGASGAIFGVIGALMLVRPLLLVWAFGMPMPMFVAGALWAFGDLAGLLAPSNVAHLAHLSGLALGLIFGAMSRGYAKRERERKKHGVVLHEKSVRNWEDSYMR